MVEPYQIEERLIRMGQAWGTRQLLSAHCMFICACVLL